MPFKTRFFFFFKGTWTTFCGPSIYFRVSLAVSLCSPGSDQVIYSWKVWRRLYLFGVFECWIFLFFMRWVFCTRDELSITELWDVRREELGVGNLSRTWWRAWKRLRTPCALQAAGSTWLKAKTHQLHFCWVCWGCFLGRREAGAQPGAKGTCPCAAPAPNPAPNIPLRSVVMMSGCRKLWGVTKLELILQWSPGKCLPRSLGDCRGVWMWCWGTLPVLVHGWAWP